MSGCNVVKNMANVFPCVFILNEGFFLEVFNIELDIGSSDRYAYYMSVHRTKVKRS